MRNRTAAHGEPCGRASGRWVTKIRASGHYLMVLMIERLFDVNRHSSLLSVYLTRKRPNFWMFSSQMRRFVSLSLLVFHICIMWPGRLRAAPADQQLQLTATG